MVAYQLLNARDSNTYSTEKETLFETLPRKLRARWIWIPFSISVILNLGLGALFFKSKIQQDPRDSAFAHLTLELSLPWTHRTEYAESEDMSVAAAMWEDISIDNGVVALDQEYTRSKGLPDAQPFPWDQSKSIYLLNGFHNLHCLKSIHRSIADWNLGLPQTYPLAHITHCLDSIRREVMCQADDTPRWTSSDSSPTSGIGQHRQCRDWDKLTEWGQKHTACYRYLNASAQNIDQIERFKFCPPGSPYEPTVRKYFSSRED